MASVIAGRIGIAKDAMIYSAQAFDTPNNEVDWMIENGVDIINCSYATSNMMDIMIQNLPIWIMLFIHME